MVCVAFLFIFVSASSVGWDLIQKEAKKITTFPPSQLVALYTIAQVVVVPN